MSSRIRKAAAIVCAIAAVASNVAAASAFELKMPTKLSAPKRVPALTYTPDILLVMPNKGLKDEDLNETMEEVHGTIVGSLGEGDLKCYIVKTEKNHMDDTEKKLTKDRKHFSTISRNYRIPCNVAPDTATNPQYPADQWHINALHCPEAWNHSTGKGVRIAVFDSGCQATNQDLAGKTDKGFDAYGAVGKILGLAGIFVPALASPGTTEAAGFVAGVADKFFGRSADVDKDINSHGTVVATTIAARMNNSFAGVGVAPDATIYPVRISENKSPLDKDHVYTTDLEIVAGMIHIMSKPDIRIINISYNAPVIGFHNAKLHPGIHVYFQKYFLERSGLIFMSSGNESFPDPTPPTYYLNLVSAVDRTYKLADFSNYGPSVSFTGPGVGIGCSDKGGNLQTPNGTSFSCPILAGLAALVLQTKPFAPNVDVINTLRKACKNVQGVAVFNSYYGWGMPDALAAVTGNNRPPATDGATTNTPPSLNVAHGSRRG